jgi:hypothetical protein
MWVRLDCTLATHRKFLRAGPEASWLWVCGLAYANQHTTDGAIPREALTALYPSDDWSPSKRKTLAAKLVGVGLWEVQPDGSWMIHGYAEHQGEAMSEAVEARREREREKKRTQRDREKRSVTGVMSLGDIQGDASGSPRQMSPVASARVPGVSPPSDRPTVRPSDAEEKELSPAPVAASPLPVQPTTKLALDLGEPTKAKRPRAAKPAADPPPFSVGDAFAALAAAAGGRFAPGVERDWTQGVRIAAAKLVRQYPDLAAWRTVGEWLAAGGDRYRNTVGPSWASSTALVDAMVRSREWAANGRGPVSAQTSTPDAIDPWAAAAARNGVTL